MKKQHRWKSEEEIIQAIDNCHETAKRIQIEADELETQAKEHIRRAQVMDETLNNKELVKLKAQYGNSASNRNTAREELKQMRKKRKTATYLIEKKAVKLGRVLAAFRTAPMIPVVGNDVSVVST